MAGHCPCRFAPSSTWTGGRGLDGAYSHINIDLRAEKRGSLELIEASPVSHRRLRQTPLSQPRIYGKPHTSSAVSSTVLQHFRFSSAYDMWCAPCPHCPTSHYTTADDDDDDNGDDNDSTAAILCMSPIEDKANLRCSVVITMHCSFPRTNVEGSVTWVDSCDTVTNWGSCSEQANPTGKGGGTIKGQGSPRELVRSEAGTKQ